MINLDDQRLLAAARDGDLPAREALIVDLTGFAVALAHDFWAPGLDRDDFRQEGRIAINKAIDDYDGSSPFITFVRLCVTRQYITAIKTANREKHRGHNEAVRLESRVETGDGETGELGATIADGDAPADVRQGLRDYVATLTQRIRTELTYVEARALLGIANGLSYAQIEHDVERPRHEKLKWVDNAAQRARRKLLGRPDPTVATHPCPGCGHATSARNPVCNVCRFYSEYAGEAQAA